ncbi:MAG: hypothetical protein SFX72_10155 [Isosphaeraceae bacterium]|nr:hypothetical protein [Isosphaeraceae bacterium]
MSRPRSTRSNAAAAAPRAGARGVYVATPKSDVYVVMLAVSLGAMLLGALLFVLILARYDFKTKVSMNAAGGSIAVEAPVLDATSIDLAV